MHSNAPSSLLLLPLLFSCLCFALAAIWLLRGRNAHLRLMLRLSHERNRALRERGQAVVKQVARVEAAAAVTNREAHRA